MDCIIVSMITMGLGISVFFIVMGFLNWIAGDDDDEST